MNKTENVTITLTAEVLDNIRKQAILNYRSINKQIAYLIDKAIKAESGAVTK